MAFVEIRELTKRYGDLTAVDRLNMDIQEGELFCLLGPNGAGKTTTMKMLAGITPPTSGSMRVGGFDVSTRPVDAKSRMCFIPDRPYMYDKLTGREYLEFMITIYGRGRVSDMDGLIRAFRIHDRLDRLIDSYSHGMRQKLLLVSAFLVQSTLLLIDEPMVGLDPASAAVLREKLKRFTGEGGIVLLSTHQIHLAETLATRVGILVAGRLRVDAPPQKVHELAARRDLESAFLAMTQEHETETHEQ